MSRAVALGAAVFLGALPSLAQDTSTSAISLQTPRTGSVAVKLGGYKPLVDTEEGLTGTPYKDTFGDSSMLLVELEIQRYFYQGIGTAGVGVSAGYAEKYGKAKNLDNTDSPEVTSLKVVPLRLDALYKFDYAAFRWHIPLVPYAKAGLIYTPWWTTKGDKTQDLPDSGRKGRGGRWGYGLTGGVAFLMDVLEPRLARDFDSDLGINHTYLFAEYTYEEVNNFGGAGLVLSSRHWMFGLSLDY
jgi:hypothetical protein